MSATVVWTYSSFIIWVPLIIPALCQMGLLKLAILIPKTIAISFFLNILSNVRVVVTRLGLYKPPPEEDSSSTSYRENYILLLDGPCPSLIPVPVTAAIKSKVPVVQFRSHLEKECCICYECVEWSDEIRELCNCTHIYHRECLDTWIDEGRITCPLCRSMLLPPNTNPHQI